VSTKIFHMASHKDLPEKREFNGLGTQRELKAEDLLSKIRELFGAKENSNPEEDFQSDLITDSLKNYEIYYPNYNVEDVLKLYEIMQKGRSLAQGGVNKAYLNMMIKDYLQRDSLRNIANRNPKNQIRKTFFNNKELQERMEKEKRLEFDSFKELHRRNEKIRKNRNILWYLWDKLTLKNYFLKKRLIKLNSPLRKHIKRKRTRDLNGTITNISRRFFSCFRGKSTKPEIESEN
jgi:hypothetical protein